LRENQEVRLTTKGGYERPSVYGLAIVEIGVKCAKQELDDRVTKKLELHLIIAPKTFISNKEKALKKHYNFFKAKTNDTYKTTAKAVFSLVPGVGKLIK
jgi:hypothetical protein